MAISNSYNFRQASEHVTTSGVVGPNRLKGLGDEGYQWLINLLPDDNEHAVPDEQTVVETQGVNYVYIPVDFERPLMGDYEKFAAALDAAGDSKIHIHCAANFRVSAFYALYAMSRGLWSEDQARGFIEDIWQPALFPEWVIFMEEVRQKMS